MGIDLLQLGVERQRNLGKATHLHDEGGKGKGKMIDLNDNFHNRARMEVSD